ncbi:unnamed protein product [Brugia timori]|uniref:Uncharacterized protein n=1 Tax=Brugia timori TaxID=42155 RepID=A0A0R3R7I5_9BILA|nr:unnamed protein product [Brugia timori]
MSKFSHLLSHIILSLYRFIELREKDVLKFGFSTREFVLLNEKSHDEEDVETVKKVELSSS